MDFAICRVPAAPVRKEPAHRSEMVNQLLFGETMSVLEEKGEWLKIVSTGDGYEGWVTFHLIEEVSSHLAGQSARYVSSQLVSSITSDSGTIHIPAGSFLTGFDKKSAKLWNSEYQFKGDFADTSLPVPEKVDAIARQWLNAPYLWGGKTLMGIDCSGFVQTVFRICGFHLKRDAWQQEQQGTPVSGEAMKGDVAFFHNEQGRVIHVGILISPHQIIHASGKVRIDEFNATGILNNELKKYTHHLHSVRRMAASGK